jgi:hypothetical protein
MCPRTYFLKRDSSLSQEPAVGRRPRQQTYRSLPQNDTLNMCAGAGGDGPGRNPHNIAGKSAAGEQHLFPRVDGQRPANLEDPC